MPEPRIYHTAVWTGTAMIVWGGKEGAAPFNSYPDVGWRYDPVTDTWTTISAVGAPSGRFGHLAVWTGRVMVVWGGHDDSGHYFNTGGRYDPATDSWTATSTLGAPSARSDPTIVWTGNVMVIWGGAAYLGPALNTGGRYDPTTDTWSSTSTVGAPVARYSHTAVWTGRHMIVWGGVGFEAGNNTGYLREAEVCAYEPLTNTWTPNVRWLSSVSRAALAVWDGVREMLVWWVRISASHPNSSGALQLRRPSTTQSLNNWTFDVHRYVLHHRLGLVFSTVWNGFSRWLFWRRCGVAERTPGLGTTRNNFNTLWYAKYGSGRRMPWLPYIA
jgi:hypothetical protein